MKLKFRPGVCRLIVLAACLVLLPAGAGLVSASDILITGIVDGPLGGGTPKAIELFILNDIDDLSDYGLGVANNGGGTDGQEFTFPAMTAAAGEFLHISSAADPFENFFGFLPDYIFSSLNVNGDDAIELYQLGAVVDIFGDVNTDGTGTGWEYLDGWAYRQSGTCFDGDLFNPANWFFSGINEFDGLSLNTAAANPFPAMAFKPVPLPAAMWFFASGLIGLVCVRNKRNR